MIIKIIQVSSNNNIFIINKQTMKYSKQQKKEIKYIQFMYSESQISDNEYKQGLIDIVGVENVSDDRMLTGQFQGDTIRIISLK